MSYIKSRKAPPAKPHKYPAAALTVLTSAALGLPVAALAQTAPASGSSAQQQTASSSDSSAATLPAVTVTGDGYNPYKPTVMSSPKFTQPIVDTTQTVQVITQQLIKEQGATTLTEAMRNVAGAGTFNVGENGSTNTGDRIYMRGIDTSNSIYIDGIRDTSQAHRDMFNTDSVEVIKGPSGSDYGRSAPSGSINMVTKQPHLGNSFDASISAGTVANTRPTLDWNQQLSDTSAFRLNMMGMKSDVAGRDGAENNRWGIAPSFAFGLGTDTRVFIDYMHTKQTNVPDGGVPTIGLTGYKSPTMPFLNGASKVDSSNFYGSPLDHDYETTDMATIKFEHDFNSRTTVRNTTRWAENKTNYLLDSWTATSLYGPNGLAYNAAGTNLNPADPSTWYINRLANINDSSNSIWSNQTNLTSKFNTGSFKHDLSAGFDITREKQYNYGNTSPSLPLINLYNPGTLGPVIANPALAYGRNGIDNVGTTTTTGIYAFDTVELSDRWEINGGLRLDHYTTDYNCSNNPTATATTDCLGASVKGGGARGWNSGLDVTGNLVNWKLGALYRLAPNGNIYVDYASSAQPPGGSNFSLSAGNTAQNPNLAPQKTRTFEVGTKWELFDKRLLATADVFNSQIYNNVSVNPDGTFSVDGQMRVQGLELGLAGMVTDKWAVNAAYTYQHATHGSNISSSSGVAGINFTNADGSNALPYTPANALSLWTTYNLPYNVTIGGGANFVSGLVRGSDGTQGSPTNTGSYWVFNAMAAYQVNKNLDFQLNVYNMFNKSYIASINKSGYRYFPGAARSAVLTANIHF
ncbi:MAG TPA: catecholate siderophore receptor Fiu [Bordetella sp.]